MRVKAQAFVLDFTLAFSLLLVLLTVLLAVLASTQHALERAELDTEAQFATQQALALLLLSSDGITSTKYELSRTKLESFAALDYESARAALLLDREGVALDFELRILSDNEVIFRKGKSPGARALYVARSAATLDSKPVVLELRTWVSS